MDLLQVLFCLQFSDSDLEIKVIAALGAHLIYSLISSKFSSYCVVPESSYMYMLAVVRIKTA